MESDEDIPYSLEAPPDPKFAPTAAFDCTAICCGLDSSNVQTNFDLCILPPGIDHNWPLPPHLQKIRDRAEKRIEQKNSNKTSIQHGTRKVHNHGRFRKNGSFRKSQQRNVQVWDTPPILCQIDSSDLSACFDPSVRDDSYQNMHNSNQSKFHEQSTSPLVPTAPLNNQVSPNQFPNHGPLYSNPGVFPIVNHYGYAQQGDSNNPAMNEFDSRPSLNPPRQVPQQLNEAQFHLDQSAPFNSDSNLLQFESDNNHPLSVNQVRRGIPFPNNDSLLEIHNGKNNKQEFELENGPPPKIQAARGRRTLLHVPSEHRPQSDGPYGSNLEGPPCNWPSNNSYGPAPFQNKPYEGYSWNSSKEASVFKRGEQHFNEPPRFEHKPLPPHYENPRGWNPATVRPRLRGQGRGIRGRGAANRRM